MDLRRVDLNLLRLVEAVLREGSVSRAARALRLSQPAVSQGLRRAREVFADPLLARHGNRLLPTPRGRALQPELSAILERIEAVLSPGPFDPATARRDFVIGTGDLAQVLVLPDLMARVAQMAPQCRIKIVPPPTDADAAEGMDLALMGAPEMAGPLCTQVLFDDHFVLLARRDHPALTGALSMPEFLALPQALVSPRSEGFTGPVDAALAKAGLSRRVILMVPGFMSLLPILLHSDMVAAVPRRFASLPMVQAHFAHRALPVDVPGFTMRAVWPITRDADPAGAWLRGQLAPTGAAGA